jgi:ABC-2 type transport system permease protein
MMERRNRSDEQPVNGEAEPRQGGSAEAAETTTPLPLDGGVPPSEPSSSGATAEAASAAAPASNPRARRAPEPGSVRRRGPQQKPAVRTRTGATAPAASVRRPRAPHPTAVAARVDRRDRPARQASGGWRVVAGKELADALTAARFVVLVLILGIAAVGAVYAASGAIRDAAPQASETPNLFLALFILSSNDIPVPPFYALVGFLAPLVGIAFGFDAVNGERSQGTLPRLLAQPIHRDDVINGKYVAGLTVVGAILFALTMLVAGIGILRLGIVPTAEEVVRLVLWVVVTVVYVGFWLAFATLCSVAFRRAATSALVAVGVWLTTTLFGGTIASWVASFIAPAGGNATRAEILRNAQVEELVARMSPNWLHQEATLALLNPSMRTLGAVLPEHLDRAIASILPLEQSLLIIWGQLVVLFALTIASFAAAYLLFLRQEVRA